jgi:hypothetical protein
LRDWTEVIALTASQSTTEFTDPGELRGERYYRLEVR